MSAHPTHEGVIAEDLGRTFGSVVALDGLSIEARPGEVVGLLGPNGAGKTTAMRILATLLTPTTGRAWVGGYEVGVEPVEVRRRLGYLTGDTGLYGRLTPREVLRYFGRLHGLGGDALEARIDDLARLVGARSFAERRCESLSTGQKQRVSIARAVVHDPAVLVLDEPTSGLDILAARDILGLFRDEADRGKAVILSTHILAEVELICDRASIIHHGTVRASGTLDDLLERAGAASLSQGFFTLLGEAPAGGLP
ncbi:MAG: ABC transporter ATP-binding protein [Myxococcota bacterium]